LRTSFEWISYVATIKLFPSFEPHSRETIAKRHMALVVAYKFVAFSNSPDCRQ